MFGCRLAQDLQVGIPGRLPCSTVDNHFAAGRVSLPVIAFDHGEGLTYNGKGIGIEQSIRTQSEGLLSAIDSYDLAFIISIVDIEVPGQVLRLQDGSPDLGLDALVGSIGGIHKCLRESAGVGNGGEYDTVLQFRLVT